MKIKDNLQNNQYRHETILVTDCFYTITDQGASGTRPLIHVCGRTWTGQRRHVIVDGFRPYFYISQSEYEDMEDKITKQVNRRDSKIVDVVDDEFEGIETGGRVDIKKIVCQVPYDVADVREWFDTTWEADVLFGQRFLIDQGITGGCTIPARADPDTPITSDAINPVDEIDVKPAILSFDIEVFVGEQGFPDHERPDQMVTAITAHDSFHDQYWTGVLEHPKWDDELMTKRSISDVYENYDFDALDGVDGTIDIYGRDETLIYEFLDWAIDVDPDIIIAWNVSFDIPYTINRALKVGCENVKRLSPIESVDEVENDSMWATRGAIKGVQIVDAINMYLKTQTHTPKSKTLEYTAQNELGVGKEEIEDTDHAWVHEPEQFVQYNIRDVQSMVEILR